MKSTRSGISLSMLIAVTLALSELALLIPTMAGVVHLDFSDALPSGNSSALQQAHGIAFTLNTPGLWWVQGDDALLSAFGGDPVSVLGVAATFAPAITSLSVDVAPYVQGVVDYTLTAYDTDSQVVKELNLEVNQWVADPGYQGSGYVTIDLGELARPAVSFAFNEVWIRGPSPVVGFGMRSLTYTQVPEPSSIVLVGIGAVVLVGLNCRPRKLMRS